MPQPALRFTSSVSSATASPPERPAVSDSFERSTRFPYTIRRTSMHPTRIAIAGTSSLLGAELKSLLEESRFAAADFRLLDEELAAGTLTEAGGEVAVIQAVEEGSFERATFVFFTGSPKFTLANLAAAQQSGAKIIDLSGV